MTVDGDESGEANFWLSILDSLADAATRPGTVGRSQRSMTIDDLRRAEAAAADLDDLGVMTSAWRHGTAREW